MWQRQETEKGFVLGRMKRETGGHMGLKSWLGRRNEVVDEEKFLGIS